MVIPAQSQMVANSTQLGFADSLSIDRVRAGVDVTADNTTHRLMTSPTLLGWICVEWLSSSAAASGDARRGRRRGLQWPG
jgi:hypothetical protein